MDTLARPEGNPPDPQAATPYFRRLHAAVEEQAALLGLPPEPWPA